MSWDKRLGASLPSHGTLKVQVHSSGAGYVVSPEDSQGFFGGSFQLLVAALAFWATSLPDTE